MLITYYPWTFGRKYYSYGELEQLPSQVGSWYLAKTLRGYTLYQLNLEWVFWNFTIYLD